MSSNYIAEFPEDIANTQANSWTYRSPELKQAGNTLARLFGAHSMDELPPSYRDGLHKILYALANSFGDTLGLMNMGNMYMNMQQAVMSGARGGTGGFSTLQASLLGVTPGSAMQLMQRANTLTSLATQFYFNDDGTVNLDNTQGMHGDTFTAYAADVARYVSQRTQNTRSVSARIGENTGVEGIEKAFKELQDKGGKLTYSQSEFLSQVKKYKEYKKGKGDWKKKIDEELNSLDKELDDTPLEGEDGIQDSTLLQKIAKIKDKLGKRAEGAKTVGDLKRIIAEADKLKEGGDFRTPDGKTITYTREDITRLEKTERTERGTEVKLYGERGTDNLRGVGEVEVPLPAFGPDTRVSEGLRGTLQEAIKDGVSKQQAGIRELADITRKTKIYEEAIDKVEKERSRKESEYITLARREDEVEAIRSDVATIKISERNKGLNEEQRERLRAGRERIEETLRKKEEVVQKQRNELNEEVKKRILGKEVKSEEINGIQVDKSTITEQDIENIQNRLATKDVTVQLEKETGEEDQKLKYYQQYKEQTEAFKKGILQELNVIRQETLENKQGQAQDHFTKLKADLGITDPNVKTIEDLRQKVNQLEVTELPASIVKEITKLGTEGGTVTAAKGSVVEEGIKTYRSEKGTQGSEAILSILRQGKEDGTLDLTQPEAIRLANIARKTKVYEIAMDKFEQGLKERDETYTTINERRKKINELEVQTFEQSEVGKKKYDTEEERKVAKQTWDQERKVQIAAMQQSLDATQKDFDKYIQQNVIGTKLAVGSFGGIALGSDVIGKDDIASIQAVLAGKPLEVALASREYNTRYQAALEANAKNIRKLSEIFETTDYGEIKGYAEKLALGDIANPENAYDIAKRLEHAKMLSMTSNRSISSVLNEQSVIVEYLKEVFGSRENISGDMIMGVQNIGELAEASYKATGTGPTRMQAEAGAVKAIGGFLDEQGSAYAMAQYALAHPEAITLGEEGRTHLQELIDKVNNAETYEEKEKALAEIQATVRNMGLNRNYRDVQAAGAEFGLEGAQQRSGTTISKNILDAYIPEMREEEGLQRFSDAASRDMFLRLKAGDREAEQTILGIFGNNGVDREIMSRTLEDISKEDAETIIEEQKKTLKSQGYSEKDIQASEKNLRAWLSMGASMRKYLIERVNNDVVGATYTTNTQRARLAQRETEAALEEYLNPEAPEGTSQGMVKDFIQGLLAGASGTQWTEKDTIARNVGDILKEGNQEAVAYDEEGNLTEKGVEYINSKANDTGMLMLDIQEENGEKVLKNKDILKQTITGANGEAIELWKAGGYKSFEEAAASTHGAGLIKLFNTLEQQLGQRVTGLGDNQHVTIESRFRMRQQQRKYNLESAKAQREEDIRELFKQEMGVADMQFDEAGNIVQITDKEGNVIQDAKKVDEFVNAAKEKSSDIKRFLASNTGEDGEAEQEVADLTGKGKKVNFSQGIRKDKSTWEKLTKEEQAEWGNKSNFDFHKILVGNLETAISVMSKTEQASAMTEINKIAQSDSTLKQWERKEDESDKDYWARLRKGAPRELLARALRSGNMKFDNADSKAFEAFEELEAYLENEYGSASGEQEIKSRSVGKNGELKETVQKINLDEVKAGSAGDSNLGGGTGVQALGQQIINLLTQIFGKLNAVAPGNAMQTTDTNSR